MEYSGSLIQVPGGGQGGHQKEEIHPEMLKALGAVGLWWLMHLVGVGACGPANRNDGYHFLKSGLEGMLQFWGIPPAQPTCESLTRAA